jgi:hypothetical protein
MTYYVATDGNDNNDGSANAPWATIDHAAEALVPDGGTVIVRDGIYRDPLWINSAYSAPLRLRAEHPYHARIETDYEHAVVRLYTEARNIIVEGFEITRGDSDNPFGVFISGNDITLRNNIIHDVRNNDLVKIGGRGQRSIVIESNIFYNQGPSDEHIDVNHNSENVTIQDNVFFNDYAASGRETPNAYSFIVVKNSGPHDGPPRDIKIRRNIFMSYQGAPHKHFILIGEDGIAQWEADGVIIENNLLLGCGSHRMRSPFCVRGSRNITIRANTVVGPLDASEIGFSIFEVGDNQPSEYIEICSNTWSDPIGNMGDFSCCASSEASPVHFDNNLFYNSGQPFPTSDSAFLEAGDDASRVIDDPQLPDPDSLAVPRWLGNGFAGGYSTIREAFLALAECGRPGPASAALGMADSAHMPRDDIRGRQRSAAPDIGAYERGEVSKRVFSIKFQGKLIIEEEL